MSIVSRITSDRDVRELLQPGSADSMTSTSKRTRLAQSVMALRISGVLQTTLDVNQIIAIFGQQILSTIHQVGIRYSNSDLDLDIRIGDTDTEHEFCHELVVNNIPLGTLRVFNAAPFSRAESIFIDYALCGLLFPLRNALLYQQALNSARKDPLTGLNNRACLDDNLRREIELARRRNDPLSLLVIDIDYFKRINDMHGHSAGDFVIKSVARCIRECLRSSDMLYRWGGEEFVVILSNTERNGAMYVAERIRTTIAQAVFNAGQVPLSATVSIGLTTLRDDDSELSLFKRADTALLHAKADGRNQIQQADADTAAAA
ncbi:MAG: GGDEF domain-containing protein [Gammaproteobacteria bacterium]|nr:GGDEF domain-containing protein [Gammaproteobacteria bacterium]